MAIEYKAVWIDNFEKKLVLSCSEEEAECENADAFIYKGIAKRAFERSFSLADHIKVIDAHMDNGLLHINLEREIPEAKKPRKIAINHKKK